MIVRQSKTLDTKQSLCILRTWNIHTSCLSCCQPPWCRRCSCACRKKACQFSHAISEATRLLTAPTVQANAYSFLSSSSLAKGARGREKSKAH